MPVVLLQGEEGAAVAEVEPDVVQAKVVWESSSVLHYSEPFGVKRLTSHSIESLSSKTWAWTLGWSGACTPQWSALWRCLCPRAPVNHWFCLLGFFYSCAVTTLSHRCSPNPRSRSLSLWGFRSDRSSPRSLSQQQASHCAFECFGWTGWFQTTSNIFRFANWTFHFCTQFRGQGRGNHHKLELWPGEWSYALDIDQM